MVTLETLIFVAKLAVLSFYFLNRWQINKSGLTFKTEVARLLACVSFAVLEVVTLTISCLNGQNFFMELVLVYVWLFNVVIVAVDFNR